MQRRVLIGVDGSLHSDCAVKCEIPVVLNNITIISNNNTERYDKKINVYLSYIMYSLRMVERIYVFGSSYSVLSLKLMRYNKSSLK